MIALGRAELLDGNDAQAAVRMLAARLSTMIDDPGSRARLDEALGGGRQFHVVRIALREKSGRVEGEIRP